MTDQPCPQHRTLIISDFAPLAHIGKGAHGRVLLVYDQISQQELALKVIEKDTLHLTSYPRIFEEQLVGKKLLDCPWAAGTEGSFQDQDHFYFLSVGPECFSCTPKENISDRFLCQKYYCGGDLTKLVRQCGKLPFSVARQYAAELVNHFLQPSTLQLKVYDS